MRDGSTLLRLLRRKQFDIYFVQRRKLKIGMQAGLASRNLAIIAHLACPAHQKEYWAVSIRVQHGVPDFQKKIRQRNFQNSSGDEVIPEPISSYRLGTSSLYDAGGAHLGARFFVF